MSVISPQGYSITDAPVNENPFWDPDATPSSAIVEISARKTTQGTADIWTWTAIDADGNSHDIATQRIENIAGSDGVTFTPHVSSAGVISWTNDGGLPNPDPVNITGPRGLQGIQGEPGETPVITATASIDASTGVPAVTVTNSGTEEAPVFDFYFTGLKGAKGDRGERGEQGQRGVAGADGVTPTISMTASILPTGGIPDVRIERTGTLTNPLFSLLFSGLKGESGSDGETPEITIGDITGGHRVTITVGETSEYFDVMDGQNGQNGQNGVSPTVTVTNITGGHRITITDAVDSHTFDVMDGQDGIGIPAGGNTGDVLTKNSSSDYDASWQPPSGGGGGGSSPIPDWCNDVNWDTITNYIYPSLAYTVIGHCNPNDPTNPTGALYAKDLPTYASLEFTYDQFIWDDPTYATQNTVNLTYLSRLMPVLINSINKGNYVIIDIPFVLFWDEPTSTYTDGTNATVYDVFYMEGTIQLKIGVFDNSVLPSVPAEVELESFDYNGRILTFDATNGTCLNSRYINSYDQDIGNNLKAKFTFIRANHYE